MNAWAATAEGQRLRDRAEQRLGERPPPGAMSEMDALKLLHELQVHQIELEIQNEELQQARREALAALQRYTELYDFAPLGYFTLGRDGSIRQLNLAGAALLGAERTQLVGKRFGVFVAPVERPAFNAFLNRLVASGTRASCEVALLNEADPERRRLVRIDATPNPAGRTANVVVSDITAVRDAEDERERYRLHLEATLAATAAAREAAEQASRAKTEFLAATGHELRTPLTNLMVVANLLAGNVEGKLTAKQLEYARIIEQAGSDLLHFVDDLLDLAHIEAGSLSVRLQPVLFPDLLQGVQRTYREIARQKELDFGVRIDADVPPAIVTDPVRLPQVLRNLLGNAIRFTRAGSVTLRVRRAAPGTHYGQPGLDEAAAVIAFEVADTGIGIAAERQAGLFDAAAPGANATAFGLPIARRIARLLGGDLRLASTSGQGSTFTVYLPVEPARSP